MDVNTLRPMTPKQKRVFEFIRDFSTEKGYPPTLQEIANHLRKSLSTAQHYVEELKSKGRLEKQNFTARGIRTGIENSAQISKLGYIAAGAPIEAIENPEPVDVPISFLKGGGNYYALEVKGNSMVEDNILDGDTIIVRHQLTGEDGDRVVAVTEDGATLKVLRKRNGKVYLEPRNKNLNPIYPKELEIRGKFCGLIRND
ncbi:MAG: transcriptional repressor LexA [Patescibacteria group bacterium]